MTEVFLEFLQTRIGKEESKGKKKETRRKFLEDLEDVLSSDHHHHHDDLHLISLTVGKTDGYFTRLGMFDSSGPSVSSSLLFDSFSPFGIPFLSFDFYTKERSEVSCYDIC